MKLHQKLECLFLCMLAQLALAVDGWVYVEDANWIFSEEEQAWYQVNNGGEPIWLTNAETGTQVRLGQQPTETTNPSSSEAVGNEKTPTSRLTYAIVDTAQVLFYGEQTEVTEPVEGERFFGQDAHYKGNQPSYWDNGDGTVSDLITGLIWTGDPGEKVTFFQAKEQVSAIDTGGFSDWRLPTIKELYSLIRFDGLDPSGPEELFSEATLKPFIDTNFFEFEYGDSDIGERLIDSQFVSATVDVGDSQFGGGNLVFGVNFADGRIKAYPAGANPGGGGDKTFFVLYVRGNTAYGENRFKDNGDGTITDEATGLMWAQNDNGEGVNWEDALKHAEAATIAGHSNWRLPNAKELQSIVDYSRSPSSTGSAAIDPQFSCTSIINEGGELDYAYYWSSTTHANQRSAANACYVSFGRAMGYYNGWQDVHGAGAQRSDPKTGNPDDYSYGHGPQGDAIRIENFVRLVRDVD